MNFYIRKLAILSGLSLVALFAPAHAMEKIAGAFLGATPPQLEAEGFRKTSDATLWPEMIHYTKKTSQGVLIQVFSGYEGQPDGAADFIAVFKTFKNDESEECRKFLLDLHSHVMASEKSQVSAMGKLPVIPESGMKDFGGVITHEAFRFDSGNRTIEYYCVSVKNAAGETVRHNANMRLRDNALGARAANFLRQLEARKNPHLQDLVK